ncbi:bifunctional riboflavin kinase/FAD synthetase [Clostridium sp. AM58-1XD]|uniref:bifunctional riboflavin kinase/FAD synthetase n=1 Tax=Clostridium sp. AM58-1XD TaxID=2292307 RepID=UPI000E4884AF|nr:bifunctional riboflavin kinase/FAD synthetase [Clostridium sp. AM58-1XD]RGZ00980.1 bifunctional riboflavin kinase/FAD synthetase [Clostridium sp. AM58-1XD]
MEYIQNDQFRIETPAVVTIGKFDGRHRGHQKLLKAMLDHKEKQGLAVAVFTFSRAPGAVVDRKPQTVITTNEERRYIMEQAGVDYLVEYPFTEEVSHMPPEEFVEKILMGKMNARAIVVGTDCGFGYRRAGNVELLEKLAPQLGFELTVIEKAQEDHRDISSSYIREELEKGNMEKANELLGSPYSIHGKVVHGNHIGSSILGFPTANLMPPPEKHLPRFGVYVSRVIADGREYRGITNIGRKPTVEGTYPVGAETFLVDFDGDLYGKTIEVQLFHFLRPEQKFDSLDELKAQIEKDKKDGLKYGI